MKWYENKAEGEYRNKCKNTSQNQKQTQSDSKLALGPVLIFPNSIWIIHYVHRSTKEGAVTGAEEPWSRAPGPKSTWFSALIPISRHQALTSLLFSFTVSLNLMKNATSLFHLELPRLQTLNYGCCPQSWSMSTKWCTGHETFENFFVLFYLWICAVDPLIFFASLEMLTWKSPRTSGCNGTFQMSYFTWHLVQSDRLIVQRIHSVNALIPKSV